jgi:hypothetical protein
MAVAETFRQWAKELKSYDLLPAVLIGTRYDEEGEEANLTIGIFTHDQGQTKEAVAGFLRRVAEKLEGK